jgi:hypothetical protein
MKHIKIGFLNECLGMFRSLTTSIIGWYWWNIAFPQNHVTWLQALVVCVIIRWIISDATKKEIGDDHDA